MQGARWGIVLFDTIPCFKQGIVSSQTGYRYLRHPVLTVLHLPLRNNPAKYKLIFKIMLRYMYNHVVAQQKIRVKMGV